jgi:hypothetical protein
MSTSPPNKIKAPDGADDFDLPIWGVDAIAVVINQTVPKTYYLLRRGVLDATQCGRLWTSTKRRLLTSLGIEIAA